MTTPHLDLLKSYLTNPAPAFSILILGERGTGKTRHLTNYAESSGKKLVKANAASFSDDSLAESELFGYEKGSFTGASKKKDGLFTEAHGGILFIDEVHNLSKRVQQKLMTALQTAGSGEHKGKFSFRRLGSTKVEYVEFRPVFASNLSLGDLRAALLPDFYDRISQFVVEFPSLRTSGLDIYTEFSAVWKNMKFKASNKASNEVPNVKELKKWLKNAPLDGNYRALEILAINCHNYRLMYQSTPETNEDKIFQLVKEGYLNYNGINNQNPVSYTRFFKKDVHWKAIMKEFRTQLYDWAISEDGYGSKKEAQTGLDYARLSRPK